MPNFIAKSLLNKSYPFGSDDVEFLWEAKSDTEKLIFTKSGKDEFFIVLKPKSKNYLIKAEKLTRPSQLKSLQKALCVYRDINTAQIVSEAISFKDKAQKHFGDLKIEELLDELKKYEKVFIEIGFGSGRHLLFQAQENQDTLVVGIEIYKPSIEQVLNLAKAKELTNIRVINTDARLLFSLIKSNSVDKVFLHFPVPWQKAVHRRVVSDHFATQTQRILKEKGTFELRTDEQEYCEFCFSKFLNLKNAKIKTYKNKSLPITSKYEDRWRRQNKDIYDLIYTSSEISDEIENLKLSKFEKVDIHNIRKNFKNESIVFDDFFIHLEKLYDKDETSIIIKLSLGAFYAPENCYILLDKNGCKYFIKSPVVTPINIKAHEALKEHLANAFNN